MASNKTSPTGRAFAGAVGPTKQELFAWINYTLGLDITSLQQLGNGAVLCQLLDAHFSGAVHMGKVNFAAKDDYEVLPNWKQFQAGLAAAQMPRALDINKLSIGSKSENLELLQWMYKQLAGKPGLPDYQPDARRSQSLKGAPNLIPVPSASLSPSFDIYGSSRNLTSPPGSGRLNYQPTGSGKINVAHVTSKWREGLAPPCLTPSTSRRRLKLVPFNTTRPEPDMDIRSNGSERLGGGGPSSVGGSSWAQDDMSEDAMEPGAFESRVVHTVHQRAVGQGRHPRQESWDADQFGGSIGSPPNTHTPPPPVYRSPPTISETDSVTTPPAYLTRLDKAAHSPLHTMPSAGSGPLSGWHIDATVDESKPVEDTAPHPALQRVGLGYGPRTGPLSSASSVSSAAVAPSTITDMGLTDMGHGVNRTVSGALGGSVLGAWAGTHAQTSSHTRTTTSESLPATYAHSQMSDPPSVQADDMNSANSVRSVLPPDGAPVVLPGNSDHRAPADPGAEPLHHGHSLAHFNSEQHDDGTLTEAMSQHIPHHPSTYRGTLAGAAAATGTGLHQQESGQRHMQASSSPTHSLSDAGYDSDHHSASDELTDPHDDLSDPDDDNLVYYGQAGRAAAQQGAPAAAVSAGAGGSQWKVMNLDMDGEGLTIQSGDLPQQLQQGPQRGEAEEEGLVSLEDEMEGEQDGEEEELSEREETVYVHSVAAGDSDGDDAAVWEEERGRRSGAGAASDWAGHTGTQDQEVQGAVESRTGSSGQGHLAAAVDAGVDLGSPRRCLDGSGQQGLGLRGLLDPENTTPGSPSEHHLQPPEDPDTANPQDWDTALGHSAMQPQAGWSQREVEEDGTAHLSGDERAVPDHDATPIAHIMAGAALGMAGGAGMAVAAAHGSAGSAADAAGMSQGVAQDSATAAGVHAGVAATQHSTAHASGDGELTDQTAALTAAQLATATLPAGTVDTSTNTMAESMARSHTADAGVSTDELLGLRTQGHLDHGATYTLPPPVTLGLLPPDAAALLALHAAGGGVSDLSSWEAMAGALEVAHRSLTVVAQSTSNMASALEPLQLSGGGAAADTDHGYAVDGRRSGVSSSSGGGVSLELHGQGKLRRVQDGVSTLLRHTSQLLGDVSMHCRQSVNRSASTAGAAAAASNTVALAQVYAERASELQAAAQSQAHGAQVLAGQMDLITPKGLGLVKSGSQPGAELVTGGTTSREQPDDGHLVSQLLVASTQQAGDVDAALKAVGVAQFSLVQGIHRESVDQQWQDWAQSSGTGDKDRAPGSRSRAFKLGEYQLKQLRNGDIYKGRRVGSRKEGDGVYLFKNGDVYEGEFRQDRMDGVGVYTFSHEGRYEGSWRGAVYNGAGSETFARGSIYSGEYESGLRCGYGVCRFYNGDYYEGQWLGGLRHGQGMQQCTDDSNYCGEYCKGKRHGLGVYTFPNSDKYAGQYCDDLPHGFGVYVFAAGQRYEGEWCAGRKHGWSTYSVEDGSQYVAHWQEGKPTWVQPLPSKGSGGGLSMDEWDQMDLPAPNIHRRVSHDPSVPADSLPSAQQMRRAQTAHRAALKAAFLAEQRALGHWEVSGPIQTALRTALSKARDAAGKAQAARARALELAQRLDVAVALATQAQAQAQAQASAAEQG